MVLALAQTNVVSWSNMGEFSTAPLTVARSTAQQQAVNEADTEFMQYLEKLTLLDKGSEYKAVALAARQKLISSQLPSMKRLREHIIECLRGGSDMGSEVGAFSRRLSHSRCAFVLRGGYLCLLTTLLTRVGSTGFSTAC